MIFYVIHEYHKNTEEVIDFILIEVHIFFFFK